MEPHLTGRAYDRIATAFRRSCTPSYGILYVPSPIRHVGQRVWALVAGCGTGVPITRHLLEAGSRMTGIDVSEAMLSIAVDALPEAGLRLSDMSTFDEGRRCDLVVVWDSFFHVSHGQQGATLSHLCGLVAPASVILLTVGGIRGEIQGDLLGQSSHYGSLDEGSYLGLLRSAGLKCILMERDHHPDEHVVFIAQKVHPDAA